MVTCGLPELEFPHSSPHVRLSGQVLQGGPEDRAAGGRRDGGDPKQRGGQGRSGGASGQCRRQPQELDDPLRRRRRRPGPRPPPRSREARPRGGRGSCCSYHRRSPLERWPASLPKGPRVGCGFTGSASTRVPRTKIKAMVACHLNSLIPFLFHIFA